MILDSYTMCGVPLGPFFILETYWNGMLMRFSPLHPHMRSHGTNYILRGWGLLGIMKESYWLMHGYEWTLSNVEMFSLAGGWTYEVSFPFTPCYNEEIPFIFHVCGELGGFSTWCWLVVWVSLHLPVFHPHMRLVPSLGGPLEAFGYIKIFRYLNNLMYLN